MRIKSVRIDGKVPVGGITLKVSDAVSWSPSAVRVPITVTLISLASVAEELAVNVSEVAGWPETRGLVAKTACTPLGNPETENWTAKLVLPDCEVMLRPARGIVQSYGETRKLLLLNRQRDGSGVLQGCGRSLHHQRKLAG
jgi:hypothetical protein